MVNGFPICSFKDPCPIRMKQKVKTWSSIEVKGDFFPQRTSLFFVCMSVIFMSHLRIYGDITIGRAGLQNRHLQAFNLTIEGSLSLHTSWVTGPRFFGSHHKDCFNFYDQVEVLRTYSNLGSHGILQVCPKLLNIFSQLHLLFILNRIMNFKKVKRPSLLRIWISSKWFSRPMNTKSRVRGPVTSKSSLTAQRVSKGLMVPW